MEQHRLVGDSQYGFVQESPVLQIRLLFEEVTTIIGEAKAMDVNYIDIIKYLTRSLMIHKSTRLNHMGFVASWQFRFKIGLSVADSDRGMFSCLEVYDQWCSIMINAKTLAVCNT